jgi:ABC-2 type transport system permease protein
MSTTAPPQSAMRSMAAESLLFASHLLTRWRRQPMVLIQALVFPTFLLIAYKLLVGKSIIRLTGAESLYGLVPMCAVAGAMFGALATGRRIWIDRDSGLVSRLWVFPVHRASALTGRLLAEAARTLVSSALITAVGVGLGLRFKGSWLNVIPFIMVPALVVVVFSMAVIAIAMRARNGSALMWLGVPATGAVFASSGVIPTHALPSWIRFEIQIQPLWATIQWMRGLAQGGPVLWPLLVSMMWILGLAAVLGPLAVRSYRAAAESSR